LNLFWEKVEKTDACWNWKAFIDYKGYGQFGFKNKVVRSHRVAWELTFGPIPSGLHVLHRCDNRKCVNPAHLFLGTNKDNVNDRELKGRHHSKRITHCPKKHEYNLINTRFYNGRRHRRQCDRDRRDKTN